MNANAKPKLNTRRLQAVLRRIQKKPARFNMGSWVLVGEGEDASTTSDRVPEFCNTHGCVAGTVLLMDAKTPADIQKLLHQASCDFRDHRDFSEIPGSIFNRARKVLGLTKAEANALFMTYTSENGRQAVRRVRSKIRLLLKNREKFVEEYGEYR